MNEIDKIKAPLAEKEENFWTETARIKREQRKCEIGDCDNVATVTVHHHNSDLYPGLIMRTCEPCRLKHYVDYSFVPLTEEDAARG
jgi:hypothetical protein